MNAFADEARALLTQFPDSQYRNSLSDLIGYTIERVK
jgi:octaprenyl-diphosphate synthase